MSACLVMVFHISPSGDGVSCQPVWWWCSISARLVMESHVSLSGDGVPYQPVWWWSLMSACLVMVFHISLSGDGVSAGCVSCQLWAAPSHSYHMLAISASVFWPVCPGVLDLFTRALCIGDCAGPKYPHYPLETSSLDTSLPRTSSAQSGIEAYRDSCCDTAWVLFSSSA